MENNKQAKKPSVEATDATKTRLSRRGSGGSSAGTQKPPGKIYRIPSSRETWAASIEDSFEAEKEIPMLQGKELAIDDGNNVTLPEIIQPGAVNIGVDGQINLFPEEETILLQSEGDRITKTGDPLLVAGTFDPDYQPAPVQLGVRWVNAPQPQRVVNYHQQHQRHQNRERIVTAQMVDEEAIADEILRNRTEDIRNRIIGQSVVATEVEKDESSIQKKWCFILLLCACATIGGFVLGITLTSDDGVGDGTPTPTVIPTKAPTTAPSMSELEELVQLLSTITAREVLLDETTKQNRALRWLHMEDSYDSKDNAVVLLNRYVLAVLYFSTNGATWFDPLNFLSNTLECEWQPQAEGEGGGSNGVRCNDEGELVSIRLDLNNLNGTLPQELSSRQSLELLSVSRNAIYGTIPAGFGKLGRMEKLNLAENNLTGPLPDTIGRLTRLEQLALNSNELTGTIPPGVAMIGSLEGLLLHENMFVGTIPEVVPRSGLTRMIFRDNFLSGTIPTSIFGLLALTTLDMGSNELSGKIQGALGYLRSLTSLDLHDNALTGPLPSELGLLTDLNELSVNLNLVNGTIPTEVGLMKRLRSLLLSEMDLTGTIPSSFNGLTSLTTLLVNDNPLTGVIPTEMGQLEALGSGTVNISNTSLTGSVSAIFCKNDTAPPSFVTADCEEVECPCCTNCCNDATGKCTVEYNQICTNLGNVQELSGQDVRGTECNCSDDGRVLSCADTTCQVCNVDETLCLESYDYGFILSDSGFHNMWRCNMRYTVGREGNISYVKDEYASSPVCEVLLDGIPCASCEVNACQDGLFGPRIDCRNVEEGAIVDLCDQSVGNYGAGWLPLGELDSGDCYSCLQY